jgi:multiple sugar transport system permease protein
VGASAFLALGGLFFVGWRGGGDLRRRLLLPESIAGFAFVSPWLLGLLLLTAGPILVSVVYSFCRYDVVHPAEFVGLDNYIRLFSDDPLFWKSLGNTAFMMLGVPLGMAVGLGIAMLLNAEVRGMRVYRTVFYLPAIVPMVASAILWIWVLNPEMGLVNSLLRLAGVADPPNWLQSSTWLFGSKSAIILMGLWSAGSGMIIWLAGLKGIPQHLYEAAEIDGAGPWLRFWHVTLPMLSPYIFFNLIMGIIGTMQIFTQAYIMTEGGPDDSTMFYAYYLFNNAFRYFKMGYASALAWILFLVILVLTLIQLKLSPRWVHYESE